MALIVQRWLWLYRSAV